MHLLHQQGEWLQTHVDQTLASWHGLLLHTQIVVQHRVAEDLRVEQSTT